MKPTVMLQAGQEIRQAAFFGCNIICNDGCKLVQCVFEDCTLYCADTLTRTVYIERCVFQNGECWPFYGGS